MRLCLYFVGKYLQVCAIQKKVVHGMDDRCSVSTCFSCSGPHALPGPYAMF